jgi:hypothetical protein
LPARRVRLAYGSAPPNPYALRVPNRRPQLKLIHPSASAEETAAIVAAIERFMRETAPPLVPAGPPRNPWQRAAFLEGTGREPDEPAPWGDPVSWG